MIVVLLGAAVAVFVAVDVLAFFRLKSIRTTLGQTLTTLDAQARELEHLRMARANPLMGQSQKRAVVVEITPDGVIVSTNDYAAEFFGRPKADMVGRNIVGLLIPEVSSAGEDSRKMITGFCENPRLYVDIESEVITPDNRRLWINWSSRAMYDKEGFITEIRLIGYDITSRKELEQELVRMATLDPLTGVLTRRHFVREGEKELKRTVRYKRDLSVLVFNPCYFQTPETAGQTMLSYLDDHTLAQIADICNRTIRESDIIGRIGDVEFAFVLPETPAANAALLAERLRGRVIELSAKSGGRGHIISSVFGAASASPKDKTIEDVMLRAMNELKQVRAEKAPRGIWGKKA
ncbi:hypothetical protein FACS1894186_1950 [Alphaproteobacteria bacterium]|nr:hypothetical protein FACS1894186_1950 [Alphaproteobacteria bacterium]